MPELRDVPGVVRGIGIVLVLILIFGLRPITRALVAGVALGAILGLALHLAVSAPGVDMPGGGLVEGAAMPIGFLVGIYAGEAIVRRMSRDRSSSRQSQLPP